MHPVASSTTCSSVQCVSAVYDEEMLVVQLQNELAKLEVDVLHTQGHNVRLEQAMKLLNEDINEKMQTIGKYEVCCHYLSSHAPLTPALQASRYACLTMQCIGEASKRHSFGRCPQSRWPRHTWSVMVPAADACDSTA